MRQNKIIVGLTGGIGSGKSTVTRHLKALGYPVVDADLIARQVVEKGKPALNAIVMAFGEAYLNEDGTLNRKKLGELVFNDEVSREKLNKIMHEKINEAIKEEIMALKGNYDLIFADIPLLIELGRQSDYDEVWLVYVDKETQINRLMFRDKVSRDFAEKQLAAQMPLESKKIVSDVILDNSKDENYLHEQIVNKIKLLKNRLTIN